MLFVKSLCLTYILAAFALIVPNTFVNPFNIPSYAEEESTKFSIAGMLPRFLCEPCEKLATEVVGVLNSAQGVPCVASIITDLCNKYKIYTPDVCEGLGNSYALSFTYALVNNLAVPSSLCGAIVKDCGNGKEFPDWNVTFPNTTKPTPVTPTLPPPNTKKFRVLHLSDIHYDQFYSVGSEANCDEPLCCRDQFGPGKNVTAGYWGTPTACDMPLWTLENLFMHLRDNETWDWMVWTGDMPPHDVWNQTKEEQLYVLNTVYGILYKYLPDRQIFFAVGNHESAPMDSFPPHFPNLPPGADISWLYDTLAFNWTHWVPNTNETQDDIQRIASYVTEIKPGLRLISINTQYCIEGNLWLYANDTDPDGTLAWLIDQLQDAEDNGIKVHIIGHAPSGDHTCIRHWSRNYYNIINRYENTVTGQFFGHTHSDQFIVFYEDGDIKGRATEVMYVAPSVTTYSYRMPTYRVYTLDSLSFEVLDTETYMLNLTEANEARNPVWSLEYKASEAYGMKSLFPEDWNKMINTFATNSTMFNLYYKYFDRNDNLCDEQCQYSRLCEMRSGRSHDQDNLCYDLPYANISHNTILIQQPASNPSNIIDIALPTACIPPTTQPVTPKGAPALNRFKLSTLSLFVVSLIFSRIF